MVKKKQILKDNRKTKFLFVLAGILFTFLIYFIIITLSKPSYIINKDFCEEGLVIDNSNEIRTNCPSIYEEVPCYDNNGNEIENLKCKSFIFSSEEICIYLIDDNGVINEDTFYVEQPMFYYGNKQYFSYKRYIKGYGVDYSYYYQGFSLDTGDNHKLGKVCSPKEVYEINIIINNSACILYKEHPNKCMEECVSGDYSCEDDCKNNLCLEYGKENISISKSYLQENPEWLDDNCFCITCYSDKRLLSSEDGGCNGYYPNIFERCSKYTCELNDNYYVVVQR